MKNLWLWVRVTKHLLDESVRRMLVAAPQILVGYSGGLDSTLLLHVLASDPQLIDKLEVLHVHHGLSEHAGYWQQRCESFCKRYGLSLMTHHANLKLGPNLEEEARHVRYAAFAAALRPQGCLVLAHHRDDQAETLLLALCRGTGLTGLVGMPLVRAFAEGQLLRPFLHLERKTLNQYAKAHELTWISDESNENTQYSRNFLRHEIMPLLRTRWPAVTEVMLTATQHCEQAQTNLRDLAYIDCPELSLKRSTLALSTLEKLSDARLVNVLREWLAQQSVRALSTKNIHTLLNQVIRAKVDAVPFLVVGGVAFRRYRTTLYCDVLGNELSTPDASIHWPSFPESLPWGNGLLMVNPAEQGLSIPFDARVEVRSRKGGEVIRWKGQMKSLKKLYQTLGIPPWLRDKIPLIYIDDVLASVVDFIIADDYTEASGNPVYQVHYEEKRCT